MANQAFGEGGIPSLEAAYALSKLRAWSASLWIRVKSTECVLVNFVSHIDDHIWLVSISRSFAESKGIGMLVWDLQIADDQYGRFPSFQSHVDTSSSSSFICNTASMFHTAVSYTHLTLPTKA